MTTTVQKQVLINARALIADRAHWTTGTLACTANGQPVAWEDRLASQWCAQGAIYRAACDLVGERKKAMHIGAEVIKTISPKGCSLLRGHLVTVNDRRGHAAVLALFDEALEAE